MILISLAGCNFPVPDWAPASIPDKLPRSLPQFHIGVQAAEGEPAPTRTRRPTQTATLPPTTYSYPEGYATRTPFEPDAFTPQPSLTPTPEPPPVDPETLSTAEGIPDPFPLLSGEDTLNIALIGTDKRSGDYFRTDTLIIASIRARDNSVALLSIPRDLYVYISPKRGMNRINTAYLFGELDKHPGGGNALLKEVIRYNLGIRIDHLAMVDFNGFRDVVNTLDGIDIPLACPYTDWRLKDPRLDEQNEDNWELFTAGPGLIHMDGDLALWYARSRSRSNDFDRGRRQQEVLRSLYVRGLQLNLIPRLPELYAELNDSVDTDITLADLLKLAPMAAHLDAPRIRSYYIHNKLVTGWWTPGGAAVLLPKNDEIQALIHEAMSAPDETDDEHLGVIVEVINGTENPGWDQVAAERLHYAGYETRLLTAEQRVTVLETIDTSRTMLFELNKPQDASMGSSLLAVLGLPVERLQPITAGENTANYRLVLGPDYRPCFNPSALSH